MPITSLELIVEDVFGLSNGKIVVTGLVEFGKLKKGDQLSIVSETNTISTIALNIEIFAKVSEYATVGDHVGITLQGVDKWEVPKGSKILILE